MQWRDDILNFGVSHFLPLFFGRHHFLLFGMACALFDAHVLVFRNLHVLLHRLSLGSLAFREIFVKLLHVYRLREFDDKERFVFLLEQVGHVGVFSEVFAEVFVALLGVEKLLDPPNTEAIRVCLALDFLLNFVEISTLPFKRAIFHSNLDDRL